MCTRGQMLGVVDCSADVLLLLIDMTMDKAYM